MAPVTEHLLGGFLEEVDAAAGELDQHHFTQQHSS